MMDRDDLRAVLRQREQHHGAVEVGQPDLGIEEVIGIHVEAALAQQPCHPQDIRPHRGVVGEMIGLQHLLAVGAPEPFYGGLIAEAQQGRPGGAPVVQAMQHVIGGLRLIPVLHDGMRSPRRARLGRHGVQDERSHRDMQQADVKIGLGMPGDVLEQRGRRARFGKAGPAGHGSASTS